MVELPYIDVKIEPGDPSLITYKPDNLLFDYEAQFTDEQTLEIQVLFEEPVYVSANKPEDTLVLTF